MKKLAGSGMLIVAALALAGCSGEGGGGLSGGGADHKKELSAIGRAYHDYFGTNNKGPANADELARSLPDAKAVGLVQSGDIVVIWNVHIIHGMPAGTVNTVLAYEKQVPEKGGHVLMGDGAVQKMSADEFNKAPKPTPK